MYEFNGIIYIKNKPVVYLPIKLLINNCLIKKTISSLTINSSCPNFYIAEEFFIQEIDKYGVVRAHAMQPGKYSCYLSNKFKVIRKL